MLNIPAISHSSSSPLSDFPQDQPPNPSLIKRITRVMDSLEFQNTEETHEAIKECLNDIHTLEQSAEIDWVYTTLSVASSITVTPFKEFFEEKFGTFRIITQDGIVELPQYKKEVLAKESDFFRSLFFSGMRESSSSEVVLDLLTSEELCAYLAVITWPASLENEEISFSALHAAMTLCAVSEKLEERYLKNVKKWQINRKNFQKACQHIESPLPMRSPLIKKALSQYFFNAYLEDFEAEKCMEILIKTGIKELTFESKSKPSERFYHFANAFPEIEWDIFINSPPLNPCLPALETSQMTDQDVARLLDACSTIHSLGLRSWVGTEQTTTYCAKKNSLTSLSLNYWGKKFIKDLKVAKEIAQLPLLKKLRFEVGERNSITDEMVSAILESPTLTTLELVECGGFTDKILKEVADHKTLTSLRISGTPLTDRNCLELTKSTSLRILDLPYQEKLTDYGVIGLSKLPLVQLNLSGTHLSDEGGLALAKSLTLRQLDLSECNISDITVCALAKAFLRQLIVKKTLITPVGFKALMHSKTLKELDISQCYLVNEETYLHFAFYPFIKIITDFR